MIKEDVTPLPPLHLGALHGKNLLQPSPIEYAPPPGPGGEPIPYEGWGENTVYYLAPEWTKDPILDETASRNYPITHTKNERIDAEIEAWLPRIPLGGHLKVVGDSFPAYLAAFHFESGNIGTCGHVQNVPVQSLPTPNQVTKLSSVVRWDVQKYDANGNQVHEQPMGESGPHEVFVTYSSPDVDFGTSDCDPSTTICNAMTIKRISAAVEAGSGGNTPYSTADRVQSWLAPKSPGIGLVSSDWHLLDGVHHGECGEWSVMMARMLHLLGVSQSGVQPLYANTADVDIEGDCTIQQTRTCTDHVGPNNQPVSESEALLMFWGNQPNMGENVCLVWEGSFATRFEGRYYAVYPKVTGVRGFDSVIGKDVRGDLNLVHKLNQPTSYGLTDVNPMTQKWVRYDTTNTNVADPARYFAPYGVTILHSGIPVYIPP